MKILVVDDAPDNVELASYKDSDRMIAGLDLGAVDYITKPAESEILLARVAVASRMKVAEDALRTVNSNLEGLLRRGRNSCQRPTGSLAGKYLCVNVWSRSYCGWRKKLRGRRSALVQPPGRGSEN